MAQDKKPLEITIRLTDKKKTKPDYTKLGFGKYFTDHMFLWDYTEGKGWHDARIVPYQNISLDPSAMVFHYGQEMFEGLKAYKTKEGKIQLFRPQKNIERMNNTNERLCIPQVDPDYVLDAIKALVKVDSDWVPNDVGTSLYIRPFIFATDPHLGVCPSDTYIFSIILSPVGAYYAEGLNPVKIYVEDEYVRAVKGGIGFAKAGGNYAASLRSQKKAHDIGYSQVLWLDGVHRKYVDEVGTMNVFFVIGDEIVTPMLGGSLLPGVTRDSCLAVLRNWGLNVSERLISIDEIKDAYKKGELKEVFGTGTAAVISPVGELAEGNYKMIINDGKIGKLSQKLYDTITAIQWGSAEDKFGWIVPVI
ncbi:MAG: branched-chain amino acid aminotransferase [Oscillospiraceae bacterium]|nr:branched-chain amino acid aminotransferase [Oscillospiraceae bacterium]